MHAGWARAQGDSEMKETIKKPEMREIFINMVRRVLKGSLEEAFEYLRESAMHTAVIVSALGAAGAADGTFRENEACEKVLKFYCDSLRDYAKTSALQWELSGSELFGSEQPGE
jgi:hypothetical protein